MANDERTRLIAEILDQEKTMYQTIHGGVSPDWLGVDLTMPQMKIIFLLYGHQRMRMGDIAVALQKNISTATGIVDHLVSHGLVKREEDPEDRRVVMARITERGEQLCDSLLQSGRQHMYEVFNRLDDDQLRIVAQGMVLICNAALATAQERLAKLGRPSSQ